MVLPLRVNNSFNVRSMDPLMQETLDLVLKASNEGIWDWEVGSEDIYYSSRIYEFFGCEEEDAPHFLQHPEEIVVEEDVPYFRNVLDLVKLDESEELFGIDCRILRLDGRRRWIRVRGVVVREAGEAVRITGSMIDISKRKRAEAALEEERSMLRLVSDNVPVQMYFKDVDSRFVLVNERQAKWAGVASAQEMVGKSDEDFYNRECWLKSRHDELRIMETGLAISGEIQREQWKAGKDTYVQIVKQPWYDSRGVLKGTFGIATDVTGLLDSQDKLEELATDLQLRNSSYKEELSLAREVQQALLGGRDAGWRECVKGLAEVEKLYVPAMELAGDYYACVPLGPGKLVLFICDVMGHGVRSALVVSMIRGVLEQIVDEADNPALCFQRVNKSLCRILGRTDVNMFATACYGVVDFNTNEFTVASAGHDFPVMINREGELISETKGQKGPALGFFDQATYQNTVFDLSQLGSIVLFTDGVVESADRAGEEWGYERFRTSCERHAKSSLKSMMDGIKLDAMGWVGSKGFDDDVCLLAMQVQTGE